MARLSNAERQTRYRARKAGKPVQPLPERTQRFVSYAAEASGASKRTIQRRLQRAAAIPNVAKLAGTSLNSGAELDALARLYAMDFEATADDLYRRALAGEKVSAQQALRDVGEETVHEWFMRLMRRATKAERRRLLHCLAEMRDVPVADLE